MPGQSILLIEDSAADVYLLRRAVHECGPDLQLWALADGTDALQFLRKEHPLTHVPTPALIIVDLALPRMSGTELIPAIRQLPPYQTTPLVVWSVTPKERAEAQCRQLGATAYVQKSHAEFSVYFRSLKALVTHWLRSDSEREKKPS